MDVTTDDAREPSAAGVTEDASASRSALARYGLSGWDATAIVAALLLVVAFAPELMFDAWTPRMVLILGFGAVGLVTLATFVARRDRPAILLAVALGWTVLVSLLADAPRSALLGVVGRDLSGLAVILAAGLWAIGRTMSERGRALLVPVLMWAFAANALVGLLQLLFDVDTGPLALAFGRPTGFDTNPVYFGALCAAGLALAQHRGEAAWRDGAVPILVLGIGVSISGSRVALAAAIVSGLAILAVARTTRAAIAAAIAGASLVLGVVIDRVAGAGTNAVNRLSDQSSGGRLSIWRYGIDAWSERPVWGYGFGQFRSSVQGRFSVDFVRVAARDEVSQAWFDPHNVVVMLLVSVGAVGTVLYGAWALDWLRRVRGPMVWALVPIVLHWMLQPVSLFSLPLAMLMFGAAARGEPDRPPSSRPLVAASAVAGVLAAGALLAGDVALRRAADAVDAQRAATVAGWFGSDPIVADIVAQIYAFDSTVSDGSEQQLAWRERVVEYEPNRPFWWSTLALLQVERGLFDAAERSIERAYELQPNNIRTLQVEMVLAAFQSDADRLDRLIDVACELDTPECGTTADELIGELEDLLAGGG